MQRRITTPGPLHDENGRLVEVGWATELIKMYDRSRIAVGRLRLKESDRLASVSQAINALGGNARANDDELVIHGTGQLRSGTVDACNDHRIAMMAAVMATHAAGPVTVHGAECVAKSYPAFWDDYARLGGNVRLAGEEL